jgi:hypothetical protein
MLAVKIIATNGKGGHNIQERSREGQRIYINPLPLTINLFVYTTYHAY